MNAPRGDDPRVSREVALAVASSAEVPPTPRPVADLDSILEEFESRWDLGERPRAEEYLTESWNEDDAVALIYHEYCLRSPAFEDGEIERFLDRFPVYRERLSRLFGLKSMLDPDGASDWLTSATWPEPGDSVGPYHLIRLLGAGSFARVYLAEQTDLANRHVVLKISTRSSPEPTLLARARHPHIVEILSHASTADGGLHLIGMPYLGGATLASLLQEIRGRPDARRPRSGSDWLKWLDRLAAPEDAELATKGTVRQHLASLGRVQAACWMIARLAEALQCAHRRGVIHGDLKPSNVLIAADGRPLLLDFNLAIGLEREEVIDQGGTLAYMSPERLKRFVLSRARGEGEAKPVVGRAEFAAADQYALGLLLVEMLTTAPAAPEVPRGMDLSDAARTLGRERETPDFVHALLAHRSIPAGLHPVLRKCLSPCPVERFSNVGDFSEELDRWITHRPFRRCEEPPLFARVERWFARHKRPVSACLIVVLALVVAVAVARQRFQAEERNAALRKIEALWSGRSPGVFRFEWVGAWRVDDDAEVGELAQRVLDQYEFTSANPWRVRGDARELSPALRDDLELWLLEHTWKYAGVLMRRNEVDQLERALALLEHDPEWAALPTIRDLCEQLRSRLAPGHPIAKAGQLPESDARERFLQGLAQEPSHAREALMHFEAVAAARVGSFWANYRAAACASRLGKYDRAAHHLKTCLHTEPENAALWTQLAACLLETGLQSEAEGACDRALAIAPDLREAIHTRAIVHALQSKAAENVERDLRHFAWLTGRKHQLRRWDLSVLLDYTTQGSQSEPRPETENFPRLSGSSADNAVAHALRGYLLEWDKRPIEAIAEYSQALESNPEHLWALYRRARARELLGRPEAMDDYQRLIDHDRAEELFGQNPNTLVVFFPLVQEQLRATRDAASETERVRARDTARRLAGRALRFAELTEAKAKIVDMHHLVARTLVKSESPPDVSIIEESAQHIRQAQRLDPARIGRKLARDRYFSRRPELPAWIPIWDPIRLRYAHQWSEFHRRMKGFPRDEDE